MLDWIGGIIWRPSFCDIDVDGYHYKSESDSNCYGLRYESAYFPRRWGIACGRYSYNDDGIG